jgi:hypothetical protein
MLNIPRTYFVCAKQCFPDQQPIGISEITGSALRSGTMLQLVIGPADATSAKLTEVVVISWDP